MVKLKLTTVGNSVGVVFPKELLAKLRVEKGDYLIASEAADGVLLTSFDPEVAERLTMAEEIMREDRDVLRKLAG